MCRLLIVKRVMIEGLTAGGAWVIAEGDFLETAKYPLATFITQSIKE